MGNDGGSIPKRDDLVKNKAKVEKVDQSNHTRATWFYCQLSKEPLTVPVVSCRLGKLYNKDSVISFLLHKNSPASSFGADGALVASHLTSLKDVTTLNLTPNPSLKAENGGAATFGTVTEGKAKWVCPISMKEMNGATKFGYFEGCGCVLSEVGLKQVRQSTTKSTASSEGQSTPDILSCPVCGIERSKTTEKFIILNPKGQDLESAKEAVALKIKEEEAAKAEKKRMKAEQKAKKRKANLEGTGGTEEGDEINHKNGEERPSKKTKKDISAVLPKNGIEKQVLEAVNKAKEKMTPAVAALYQKGSNEKETWMTRGTWTRYAG